MDFYDSDEDDDGTFDILRRSVPITEQDIEAQLSELRRLAASIKYQDDDGDRSPKSELNQASDAKIAKQKVAIDSQIADLEAKLAALRDGETILAITRSPQLRGAASANRQLVRPGSRLSSVRETSFGSRSIPQEDDTRNHSGSDLGSDAEDFRDPFPSPVSEVKFSEVEVEGISSTSFDPRHTPAHSVDRNLQSFFMTTGMYPQDLCINFQSRTIVKKVEVICSGINEMSVICSDSFIKRTSFQGESTEDRSQHHTFSDEHEGVVAKHIFELNSEQRCRMLVVSIEKGFAEFASIFSIRVFTV